MVAVPTMKLLITSDSRENSVDLIDYLLSRGNVVVVLETDHGAAAQAYAAVIEKAIREQQTNVLIFDECSAAAPLSHRIRAASDVPIMILARAGDNDQIVQALDSGADDYMVGPYRFPELLARIQRLADRHARVLFKGTELASGDLRVDIKQHTATVHGKRVPLTKTEYQIVSYLLLQKGYPVSRKNIALHSIASDIRGSDHTIDTHILNIRKKIGAALHIANIPNQGFIVRS